MALPRCLLLLLSLHTALTWSLVGAKEEQTIEEQLIDSVLAQGGKLVRPRGSCSLQPSQMITWHPRAARQAPGGPPIQVPPPATAAAARPL